MIIFLVDDHELIRDGLTEALRNAGHQIAGVAISLADARSQMAFVTADLYIVDVQLPDGSGLDLISRDGKFVVLTIGDDVKVLEKAHQAGARAYVLKGESVSHLLNVIEQVGSDLYRFDAPEHQEILGGITPREREILHVLRHGLTTPEIASLLFLSDTTVKTHLASIYRKLQVTNRTQEVVSALALGLI
jgi:DNA-binding NarL/FixJ family response regulator